jgi:hypothetical protein
VAAPVFILTIVRRAVTAADHDTATSAASAHAAVAADVAMSASR